MKIKLITLPILGLAALFSMQSVQARSVNISPELPYVDITYFGKKVRIERIQDQKHKLTNGFAKTSRKCPPFCVQPMKVAPGVRTVGEMELLDFLLTKAKAKDGSGMLIDARTPQWHKKGTIPGSVNIPFTITSAPADDPNLAQVLKALGAKKKGADLWDFRNAKSLMLFCNGPWCGQASRAIKGLMHVGYPPEKLHYFRGGMQTWQLLGLTVVKPGK